MHIRMAPDGLLRGVNVFCGGGVWLGLHNYVKPTYGQHKIIFTKREAFVTFVLSLEVDTNCNSVI